MKKTNVNRLVAMGLLIALEIVLSRFLSISLPLFKVGFAFLPTAVMGILYGPWVAGIGAVIADIIGASLFPVASFFPGFTLSAFLRGFGYGMFLHKTDVSMPRLIVCCTVLQIVLSLGLNTLWLHLMAGMPFLPFMISRIPQVVLMIPVMVMTIWFVHKRVLSLPLIQRHTRTNTI